MKKELKEYLHLYLFSGISVFIFPDESITDGFLDKYRSNYPNGVYDPTLTVENYKRFLADGYKPILRPLSDMTDEEALQCHLIEHPLDKNGTSGKQVIDYYRNDPFTTPEPFRYLLKQGFDIFCLIDEGLAIDKTKLLNSEQNPERSVATDDHQGDEAGK